MKMKKRFLVFALLVILLSIIAGTTLTYYTATDTATNVITSSGVDIELVETTEDGEPFANVAGIMPGTTVSKIVKVRNKQADAYVRVSCEVEATGADGKPLDLSKIPNGDKAIVMDLNLTDWALGEDGYYYYKYPLEAGDITEPLFTEVSFDAENMGNEFQNAKLTITVQAQATQVAHNGSNYAEAAGWPKA